jgi:hypothetical protein
MVVSMTREDIIDMIAKVYGVVWTNEAQLKDLEKFAALVASAEREACEALHDHEDVQAPIGNSSWGEAYQEGWAQGTAAYRDAIKARVKHE